jgi:hypothetical protein
MKKVAWILLLPLLLFALSTDEIEKKIYRQIFDALFPNRVVKIWTDRPDKIPLFTSLGEVRLVQTPMEADTLLIFERLSQPGEQPVIVGRYGLIRHYGNRVVAGFYWKKGRPHIIFWENGLRHYGITLPPPLHRYLERDEP